LPRLLFVPRCAHAFLPRIGAGASSRCLLPGVLLPGGGIQVVQQAERDLGQYWSNGTPIPFDVFENEVFKDAWALRTELDSPRYVTVCVSASVVHSRT
jgi:hypothetical protein